MSETLAGVTILAWANGAPDVIVSLSAGGIEGGLSLAIGSLFGAGLFTTTIVFGYCLYITKTLEVFSFPTNFVDVISLICVYRLKPRKLVEILLFS